MRASFAASASDTVVVPLSARLRFVVLLLRRCCLNALLRRNLPPLVRLKRLAAPRCVLIFCLAIVSPTDHRGARRTRRVRELPLSVCGVPRVRVYVVDDDVVVVVVACFGAAAGFALPPPVCGRRLRIVCI